MSDALPKLIIKEDSSPEEKFRMKRVIVFLMCLALLATTVAPAGAQVRRKHSSFGHKARTVAIIGGGTAVGALIGGEKGAATRAGGRDCSRTNTSPGRAPLQTRNNG